MRARWTIAFAVLCALGMARSAWADRPDYRKMSFFENSEWLSVSTTFTELFDSEAYRDLSSGFPTSVVLRIYVYQKGQELPVTLQVVSMRVIYDLWEDEYVLRVDGPEGRTTKRYASRVEVLRKLTQLQKYRIAAVGRIQLGVHYFLALSAELNPVEEEMLAEMRRWLTKSTSDSTLDSSSSFFGSFVSVFVNPKLQKAERIVRLRSQPFYRVKPGE